MRRVGDPLRTQLKKVYGDLLNVLKHLDTLNKLGGVAWEGDRIKFVRSSVTIIITLKPYIATDVSYHNETDLFNCAENFPHSIHLWFITEGEI